MDMTAQASEQVVDQFRVQISLGSTIESISEITENGLTVTFENGDICDSSTGQKYTSQINFLCDQDDNDNEYTDWNKQDTSNNNINNDHKQSHQPILPEFLKKEECHFTFNWRSKFACSQCRIEQLDFVVGQCGERSSCGEDEEECNFRKIVNKPQKGNKCILYDNFVSKNDGTPIHEHSSTTVVQANFMLKPYQLEECNIYEDIVYKNPLIKLITAAAAILATMLAICGFFICCSYCQLERRYTSLQDSVRNQMQEVGLPDDYEYDEDNIYMQEAEKARRAGLSVAQRKREDGIQDEQLSVIKKRRVDPSQIEMEEIKDS